MKQNNSSRRTGLIKSFFSASILLLLASCTSESRYDEVKVPETTDAPKKREVLLTLNNQLTIRPAAAGRASIATPEENTISTLDVYVFGSASENGEYTFQQRFAYRSDEAADEYPVPADADELVLSGVTGEAQSTTTGLLSLKRGLFVKIYCVANNTILMNPATNKAVIDTDFTPIKFNEAGNPKPVAVDGSPKLKDFELFHTALLQKDQPMDAKGEVLLTPLSMSGAMTTPLNLTDAASGTRLQTSLKLTRLAARFDISNDASKSHFTITSIGMAKGRRATSFFPIAVKGDELITIADRSFSSDNPETPNANKGLQTGAFYSYPSLKDDEGYLILKGLYQVNKTETKEVSYPVRFRQNSGNDGAYLEINHNHRYTLNITDADAYNLDFILNVADWTDDGKIDDYVPDNKPGEIKIDIAAGFDDPDKTTIELDPDRNIYTVSMSVDAGSAFTATIPSAAPLTLTRTYADGGTGRQYDWLEIEEPKVISLAATNNIYKFSLKPGYIPGRYPRTTVRFFDTLSGEETVLYVVAKAAPTPIETPQPGKAPNGTSDNPNSFDATTSIVTLYKIENSRADITVECQDGAVVDETTVPTWLTVTKESEIDGNSFFSLTLKDKTTDDASDTVTFLNSKHSGVKNIVTVNLEDASIKPDFTALGGTNNTLTDATDIKPADVAMTIADKNTFQVSTTSMDGISVKTAYEKDTPEWLSHTGTVAAKSASPRTMSKDNVVTFSLVNDKLSGAKPATVTFVNKIGGIDYEFTVTPKLELGTMVKFGDSFPTEDAIDDVAKSITLYKIPGTIASTMQVEVTSYGGSTLSSSNDAVLTVEKFTHAVHSLSSSSQEDNLSYYTLTAVGSGSATLTHSNLTDASQKQNYAVTVKSTAITVSTDTPSIIAAADGKTSQILTVSSLAGCTAEILDGNWGDNGGTSWFTFLASIAAGTDVPFSITQPTSNTSAIIRPVTIRLSNSNNTNPAWGYTDVVLTPTGFKSPSVDKSSLRVVNTKNIPESKTGTFTVTAPPLGGIEIEDDESIVSHSISGSTVTVTYKTAGIVNLTVRNKSDNTKTSSPVTVTSMDYKGNAVWQTIEATAKTDPYYIAMENAVSGEVTWSVAMANANTYCNDIEPKGTWRLPTKEDIMAILNVLGVYPEMKVPGSPIYDEYYANHVFGWESGSFAPTLYWSSTADGSSNAFRLGFGSSGTNLASTGQSNTYRPRCVARP